MPAKKIEKKSSPKKTSSLKNTRRKHQKNGGNNKNSFCVVGVGASAGGIEAISNFLKALPPDTGMAFIFVMHLSPDRESQLTKVFSNVTKMEITQISRNTEIKPNNVYIIPPGKYLKIKNTTITLIKREKTDGLNLPINIFFQSLAEEMRNRAIGILLSGGGTDGTLGQKYIKAEGGLTFAQDEESAKFPELPQSSIIAGHVDLVLPPEKIARELVRISKHPYIALSHPKRVSEEDLAEEKNYALRKILTKLLMEFGVDFSLYKSSTIHRRISRRMVINKVDNYDDYSELLKENKDEIYELYSDMLINVTNFFRDPEAYTMLNKEVFPIITKNCSHENPIRIWVPGCSTGEEVYSIVISLFEYLKGDVDRKLIQIFGTDISESSLDKARIGIYSEANISAIPEEILKRYFHKTERNYQIHRSIRTLCVFAKHDLTKDPPFSNMDLISCRNVLIYLSADLQKKIMPTFYYSLKQGRFLMLGTSESIGSSVDFFKLLDKKYKLYSKKDPQRKVNYQFNTSNFNSKALSAQKLEKPETKEMNQLASDNTIDIKREVDKILLDKYSPSGILVNSHLEIIQFRGEVQKFISPASGEASLNIFRMIKESLSLDLHSAILKVKKNKRPISVENISFNESGSIRNIDIEIIPVKSDLLKNDYSYLILFLEPVKSEDEKEKKKTTKIKPDSKDRMLRDLKEELLLTREELQSIIHEKEISNEELRSTMEELQSSNEDLQNINEETETIREELQSTNEELVTVNDELESRNEELNETNNDLINLLSSFHIPIIMLSNDMKIRRYTPMAAEIWNLIPGDIGRPINNIKSKIELPNLKNLIDEVIDNLETKEVEVKDGDDKWYSMKIRPYKKNDNTVDGVVISLIDIDILKKDVNYQTESKDFLQAIFDTIREPLLILNNKFYVEEASSSFLKYFHVKENETKSKKIFELGDGQWNKAQLEKLLNDILIKDKPFEDFIVEHNFPGIGEKKLSLNARKIKSEREKTFILLSIKEN